MQTFLPYPDFTKCASCLDDKRVNKQIIEARTIYNIVSENITEGGWVNHPIVKMWRGYHEALALYYNAFLYEWKIVRYKNHKYLPLPVKLYDIEFPPWLGDDRLHSSHRANLLRKDYTFYSKYGWNENNLDYNNMPYWWNR